MWQKQKTKLVKYKSSSSRVSLACVCWEIFDLVFRNVGEGGRKEGGALKYQSMHAHEIFPRQCINYNERDSLKLFKIPKEIPLESLSFKIGPP